MTVYSIGFVDHGENVYSRHEIDEESDEAAIEKALRLNGSPRIGAGFDLWHEDRLVHRHRQ